MPQRLVLAVSFVLCAVPAIAAPIPVGEAYGYAFHAETCHACPFTSTPQPNITMDGVLTVIDVTNGFFPDPVFGDAGFHRNVAMVTDIQGTLVIDCGAATSCSGAGTYDLSFRPNPIGDGSYLIFNDTPNSLTFAANGLPARIINDHSPWNLYSGPGGNNVKVMWEGTRVPAPSVPDASSSRALGAIATIGLVIAARHGVFNGCG